MTFLKCNGVGMCWQIFVAVLFGLGGRNISSTHAMFVSQFREPLWDQLINPILKGFIGRTTLLRRSEVMSIRFRL